MPSVPSHAAVVSSMSDPELLSQSPFLLKLSRRRLAPSRMSDLYTAARAAKPPKEPELWECCGSSCKPCVNDLYREERRVWDECHPDGEDYVESAHSECDDDGDDEPAKQGNPQIEIGIEQSVTQLDLGISVDKATKQEDP
ncbi:uncharacterized protein JCM15063_000164 [Sporobolomyces koalae]|uniref:uncharacterized protein n=1 Tax=Sporobolomyces koalae TaxID=500713 RepID=UPI00317E0CD5